MTMPPDPFTKTGTRQGDDTINAIIYCASLAVRGWREVMVAHANKAAAVGDPHAVAACNAEAQRAMAIFQMAMAALERAFLIPPDGHRPPDN